MYLQKILTAVAVMLLMMGTVLAEPLTPEQISEAQREANKIVPQRKISFVYRAMDTSESLEGGNFLVGDKRTTADIYWITPFAYVMNEQIEQSRSGQRDFSSFQAVGSACQIRILFNIQNFNRASFLAAKTRVAQGKRVLVPSRVLYANLQRAAEPSLIKRGRWQRIGVVLDFPATEIEPGVPIEVTVTGDGGAPLIFPPLENDGPYAKYRTKSHEFLWYPLHESL